MYGAIPTTATRPLAAAFWAGKVNRRGSDDEIGEDRAWQPSHQKHHERLRRCLDAHKHPELYRDLVVRIAGYCAYFVNLSPVQQAEINARTEERI
jgi:hypothetical protein